MNSIQKLILLCIVVSSLIGCSSGGSDNNDSLKIEAIQTDILHSHSSFYEKWNYSPVISIRFTTFIIVKDPLGVSNLKAIYIRNKTNDRFWDIFGGPNNRPLEDCYDSAFDTFECVFHSSVSLDKINLKNWEVVVENRQGVISHRDFEFLLPGGDSAEDTQFVYSSIYNGSKTNGIPAIEAMTIAENGLVFRSDSESQSFHIEFETTDSRAKHYSFIFYDDTESINAIGGAKAISPSITSMPIVFGQKTKIDLPWSEINIERPINDINGLHIVLFDEPIEWLDQGIWFNYRSLSEFLTLSP